MNSAELSKHPAHRSLALYARGDLPFLAKAKVRSHLRQCGRCQQYLAGLQSALAELRREAGTQTLTGFEAIADWSRLEREMLGNIGVGVAAARCVDYVGGGRRTMVWSAAAAALLILFVAAWATHIPREETERLFASLQNWSGRQSTAGTVLRSSPDGVAVRTQGSTLTLMHPRSAIVSVSSPSVIEARYVDGETGQVTITSVYAQ